MIEGGRNLHLLPIEELHKNYTDALMNVANLQEATITEQFRSKGLVFAPYQHFTIAIMATTNSLTTPYALGDTRGAETEITSCNLQESTALRYKLIRDNLFMSMFSNGSFIYYDLKAIQVFPINGMHETSDLFELMVIISRMREEYISGDKRKVGGGHMSHWQPLLNLFATLIPDLNNVKTTLTSLSQ